MIVIIVKVGIVILVRRLVRLQVEVYNVEIRTVQKLIGLRCEINKKVVDFVTV